MLTRLVFCARFSNRRLYSVQADVREIKHPFRSILTKESAIQYLSNNVIYSDDYIIAFNKPAGIGKARPIKAKETSLDVFYMEDVINKLPMLSDCPKPTIVKFPEKYSSGLMVIAKSDEAVSKVAKCKLRAKSSEVGGDTYLTISVGHPIKESKSCKLALKLSKCPKSGRSVPMFHETWSRTEMLNQKVKIVRLQHEVVAKSPLASLTRVSLTSNKSNALRLYFATILLSPILGDTIFSGRVKNVLGSQILIDPWSNVANSPQRLSKEVLEALHLSNHETSLVPFFVHLEEVRFPGYRGKQDLVLCAPIPDTFSWVCRQLQLPDVDPSIMIDAGRSVT